MGHIYSDGATLQVEFGNSTLSQRSAMQLTEPPLYTSMFALQRRCLQIIQRPSLNASNTWFTSASSQDPRHTGKQ